MRRGEGKGKHNGRKSKKERGTEQQGKIEEEGGEVEMEWAISEKGRENIEKRKRNGAIEEE